MELLTRLEKARKRSDADGLLREGSELFCRARHEAARETWQKALGLYQELHDGAGIAAASMNIAPAAYSLSEYRDAVRYGTTGLQLSVFRKMIGTTPDQFRASKRQRVPRILCQQTTASALCSIGI